MKQITSILLLAVIAVFCLSQTAFAASNTVLGNTGLTDIVKADDTSGDKKKEGAEGDDEPDCD